MNFADNLLQQIDNKKSSVVVGLDPRIEFIPESLLIGLSEKYNDKRTFWSEAILLFNKKIIDAVYDLVPAVKPQCAFYEVFGYEGMRALEETCAYAKKKGLLVILDAKRNDIGSTAAAYSQAYLNSENEYGIEVDSITINAYLGADGITPFTDNCKKYNKGVFVLVKTSNESSSQFQDLIVNGRKIYEHMASNVDNWGSDHIGIKGYSSVGAVVGATYSKQMQLIRKIMPRSIFLVPGYGAQGGKAEDIKYAFNNDGYGAVISASRSITYAYRADKWKNKFSEKEFDLAARAEVVDMNNNINKIIQSRQ
jgi:orotidine-5'-phosphate decarboxylase